MNYYRIGICDDEEIVLNSIYNLIKDKLNLIKCEYELIKYTSSESLLNAHRSVNFDLVFLDIDMPEINGLTVAANIKTANPDTVIIFITGKDELVYESFKVQPFRFIRKSRLTEEITEAITEAVKILDVNSYQIEVRADNKTFMININSILYIENSRNYIIVHTVNNKQFKYKDSINLKDDELKPCGFIRTHVGYLVNQRYIQRISGDNVLLINNLKIPISRSRKQYVKKRLIELIR